MVLNSAVSLLFLWPWSYVAVLALLLLGLARLRRSVPVSDAEAPSVSVVVTARNEARDLPRCLSALAALDYPAAKLQFVLVNDRSTDATGDLLEAFATAHPNAVVLHTERLPDNGLESKARGLAHGLDRATGEWLLITDADGAVPAGWVRHLLGEADAQTTMVSGALRVRTSPWWGWFEGAMQLFLMTFSLAAAGFRRPFICVGPNMGIRGDVYRQSGGLSAQRFRVAEDLALFRIAAAAGHIRQYADPATTVEVSPVPRPALLASQLRRWLGGGIEQHPAYLLGLTAALVWGLGCAAFLFTGWRVVPVSSWLLWMGGKLGGEWLLLGALSRRLGGKTPGRLTAALQPYQLVAVVFIPLSLLVSRRLRWVGEGYTVTYR